MRKRSKITSAVLVVILVVALVLPMAGCQSKTTETATAESGNEDNVIKVVSVSALSGAQSPFGEMCRMGAEMAFEERKAEIEAMGFKLEFIPTDDAADPKMGVSVAQKLVADPDVLAINGHTNSGVCIPASEVYNKAMLAMYTPMATNPQVTALGYENVGRICGRDDVQGTAAARFAFNDLGAKTSFILHDKSAYGQGAADEFKKKAEVLGMETLGYEGVTQGEVDFSAVVNKIVAAKPDCVYFGGNYAEAALVLKGMREKGNEAKFVACDGVESQEFVKIAGSAAVGSYYTSMTPLLTATEAGRKFLSEFQAKYNKQPESYGYFAYDTGRVIMQGLADAIKGNGGKKPSREQVCEALRKVEVSGITGTGTIKFDENGDNVNTKSYIMQFTKEVYPGDLIKEMTKE